MTVPKSTPRIVSCPPAPEGCGAEAGERCMSHGGTRERHDFHRVRTAAWEAARLAAHPAAKLIADAAKERRIRHGSHAASLLREHGYAAEADHVQDAVTERNGHLSAKQAAQVLIDVAEAGEDQ